MKRNAMALLGLLFLMSITAGLTKLIAHRTSPLVSAEEKVLPQEATNTFKAKP